jgi:hypothetical protein
MSNMRHLAIVVTGYQHDVGRSLQRARRRAINLHLPVSGIVSAPANGFGTFVIASCGSTAGSSLSGEMHDAREQWKAGLGPADEQIDWVEVSFGGEGGLAQVVAGSLETMETDGHD